MSSRPRFAKAALAAAAFLLALALAEVGVRAAALAPAVKAIWLSDDGNVYQRSSNPVLGFELKPNYRNDDPNPNHSYPSTNAHGQRDIERTLEKPAGVTRILLLGDSVVEGHGIMAIDATISRQLEQLFPDGSTEVLNFGVSGYCTLSEVELLETKGLAFEPDMVVLVFVSNDFRNFNPVAFELDPVERPELAKHLFLRSHLFRIASVKLDLFGFGEQPELAEWNNAAIGDNNVVDGLRRFGQLASTHGFQPVVAIWPERVRDQLVDEPTLEGSRELVIESLARGFGIRSFRFSPFFAHWTANVPGAGVRQLYLPGDPLHPSAVGTGVAAQAMREVLSNLDRYAPAPEPSAEEDLAAIEAAAAFGNAERPSEARRLNNRGRRLREGGQLEEAAEALLAAIAVDPELPEPHFNLGIVYQEQGRTQEAEAAYRESLEHFDENEEAHHNLGLILLGRGALDEAAEHFAHALSIEPSYANAELGLGNVRARQDRLEEARDAFRRAVELDPNHVGAHSNLGNTYLAVERAAEAIPHYRRALELDPEHFNARFNLAYALELTGELEEAIAEYRLALGLRPDHPAPQEALDRLAG